jgi:hypothetical protein
VRTEHDKRHRNKGRGSPLSGELASNRSGAGRVLALDRVRCRPNGMRISCRLPSPRPHKPTFHSVLEERLHERNSAPDRPVGCMRG